MTHLPKPIIYYSVLFGCLCATAFGVFQLLVITKWGAGLSPDSTNYILYAQSIIKNKNLSELGYNWPPFYPILLATINIANSDLLSVAKWFQVIILTGNIFLFGSIIYRSTEQSLFPTIIGFSILATSQVILEIHGMVWSEPLFLLLSLFGFYFLSLYIKQRNRYIFLASSAAFIGLATITRYAGIALILASCASLLILGKQNWKKRFLDILFYSIICLFPLLLWFSNFLVTNNPDTTFSLSPNHISIKEFLSGTRWLSLWLHIPFQNPYLLLVILISVAVLLIFSSTLIKDRSIPRLCEICFIFVLTYIPFILLSKYVGAANIPLDRRILSPVYFFLFLGLILLTHRLTLSKGTRWLAFIMYAYLAIIVPLQLQIQFKYIDYAKNGIGFAAKTWVNSDIISWIKHSNINTLVYTNGPDPLSIYTSLKTKMIPRHSETHSRNKNENFNQEINEMVSELVSQKGIIIYFSAITWRWYLPTEKQLVEILPLKLIYKGKDGAIYSIDINK